MALAAVLSAMKELILDAPALPEEQSVREKYIKKSFPDLKDTEAEDLAKIPPAKFKIYTNSIFSSERDLIQTNFGMTIEYLKKYWKEEARGEFNLFQIIKELHKKRPWKSTHTVDLGRNFVDFVKNDLKRIQKKAPFINELAEMELLLRIVRRSSDDEIMPKHSLTGADISAKTVEEILNLSYIIPTCVEFTVFNYSLIEARSAFVDSDKKDLPKKIKPRKEFCSLSRNFEALQRWTEYDENFYDILSTHERQKPQPLSVLAEKFLEKSDDSRSEEDLFKEFIEVVYRCIKTGVLIVK
jgi:hypothetical protein